MHIVSTNFAKTLGWKHEYDVKLWRYKECSPNTVLMTTICNWMKPRMKIFCARHWVAVTEKYICNGRLLKVQTQNARPVMFRQLKNKRFPARPGSLLLPVLQCTLLTSSWRCLTWRHT